jgi:hypothetical protein
VSNRGWMLPPLPYLEPRRADDGPAPVLHYDRGAFAYVVAPLPPLAMARGTDEVDALRGGQQGRPVIVRVVGAAGLPFPQASARS